MVPAVAAATVAGVPAARWRLEARRSGRVPGPGGPARPAAGGGGKARERGLTPPHTITDHRLKDADIVDHLVELVERKAAEIEAAKRNAAEAALETAE
jgi:(E)-4-hydroxy-3-methylbut-2-enyl-diphosphate synthase